MKHTTTLGIEVDVYPLGLTNKEGFKTWRKTMRAFREMPDDDDTPEGFDKIADWMEEVYALFLEHCDTVGIPRNAVSFHDVASIFYYYEHLSFPKKTDD